MRSKRLIVVSRLRATGQTQRECSQFCCLYNNAIQAGLEACSPGVGFDNFRLQIREETIAQYEIDSYATCPQVRARQP
jgi:hypothetical protein